MEELLQKALPVIPEDIRGKLAHAQIALTSFENREEVLRNHALWQEIGYRQFTDGSWLVSMTCPMPGITPEMIMWWFWWHCQEKLRYQIWFPGAHINIHYDKKNQSYFQQAGVPPFEPNSQYPLERIGGMCMPLRIDFVTPEEFGFSRKTMNENGIPVIICGHVSAFRGIVRHTEMAHIFMQTEDGLFLVSRFWLGELLENRLLRKMILTEKTARGMAEHCCIEYRNLVEILPELYQKYGKPGQASEI